MRKFIIIIAVAVGLFVSGTAFANLQPFDAPWARYIYRISGQDNRRCTYRGPNYSKGETDDTPEEQRTGLYSQCSIEGAAVHVFDDGENKCYTIIGDVTDQGEIRDVSISCVKK